MKRIKLWYTTFRVSTISLTIITYSFLYYGVPINLQNFSLVILIIALVLSAAMVGYLASEINHLKKEN